MREDIIYSSSEGLSKPGDGMDEQDLKGGGFMQTKFSSSQRQTSYYGQRLIPVTAHMVNSVTRDPEDANRLVFEDIEVLSVSLVGNIISVTRQNTYSTFAVNDGTNTVEVQKWNLKINDDELQAPDETLVPGTPVHVFGSLRMFNDTVNITAQEIRKLQSFDEISCHIMSVVHAYLKLKNATSTMEKEMAANDMKVTMDTPVDDSKNELRQKILDALKTFSDIGQGVKRNKIFSLLKAEGPEEEINNVINSLIRDGLVYVTINYDYIKAL